MSQDSRKALMFLDTNVIKLMSMSMSEINNSILELPGELRLSIFRFLKNKCDCCTNLRQDICIVCTTKYYICDRRRWYCSANCDRHASILL